MRSNPVLPFLTIRPGDPSIEAHDWFQKHASDQNISIIDPDHGVSGWAYNIPLVLQRKVSIDPEGIRDSLEISGSDAAFEIVVIGKVGSLGQRSILRSHEFNGMEPISYEIEIEIDSRKVCEHITLLTILTLKQDLEGCPDWAPSVAGSKLWSDEIKVPVEGSGSRFRIQDLRFSEDHRIPSDARWHLEWNPELAHYSFNSVVRLLVNSEHEEFVRRLIDGDEILTKEVMCGIVCEICVHMLERDSFLSNDDPYPEGSLGEMTKNWLELAFPNSPLNQIRQQYMRSPNLVTSQLRALVERI